MIGRNGEFDEYAASVIKRAQKEIGTDNSDILLVLPYSIANLEYYEKYYDGILLPESVLNVHPKSAITQRNRWMVEQSDLVITYIEHQNGGAWQTIKYAMGHGKTILNLAADDEPVHL